METMLGDTAQEKYLWYVVLNGVHKKFGDNPPQVVMDRISEEMKVINGNKFTDYILMIWDIHDFCRDPKRVIPFCVLHGIEPPPDGKIPLGPGRGSVGGSMVCHLIDIHKCDPILFDLYFERFLNSERISMPDIDIDVSQRYRHILLAYIASRYGERHVSQIITYGTLSTKSVVEAVLKAANVPMSSIKALKETIPDDPAISLKDMVESKQFMDVLRAIHFPDYTCDITTNNIHRVRKTIGIDMNGMQLLESVRNGAMQAVQIPVKSTWDWEKALAVMQRLEGLNKHESTHSAGVIVSPIPLNENVPLMRKSGKGGAVCQYDMRIAEDIGYLKMDILGLRTVDVNHDAERMVREWIDPSFDLDNTAYNIRDAIELIRSGDTTGVFQIESSGFTQMMQDIDIGGTAVQRKAITNVPDYVINKKNEINDFMWISAGIAMYRPGPLDAVIEGKTMVQHLIDRKSGNEPVIYLFPEEENYLAETYGIMVYQEQVMKRVQQMTGCTMGRADILRKAMGKKNAIAMEKEMNWFTDAAMSHTFSEKPLSDMQKQQIIQRAKDEIEKFARYGFNKAHTVEYAHICYWNAVFKSKYPAAFYASLLNSEKDDSKRQAIIIGDMVKHSVQLLPPAVSVGNVYFTMTDPKTVRFGLAAIAGIGDVAMRCILDEIQSGGGFKSVEDFRVRIPANLCNVAALTNLAKCGAFDDVLDKGCIKIKNRATLVASIKDINEKINKLKQKLNKKEVTNNAAILEKVATLNFNIEEQEEDLITYAVWEKNVLNYFISAHPLDAYRDEMRRWNSIGDTEIENLPDEFYIAGFISDHHTTTIKKQGRNQGKQMGFVTVENEYRAYEATLFPGIYESCAPFIQNGNAVVLKGTRSSYKGNTSIQGVYIRNLKNSGIRDCPECHIRLNDVNIFQLMELKNLFNQYPGITQVYFHTEHIYNDFTVLAGQTISLNDVIINYCESIGVLSYKEV